MSRLLFAVMLGCLAPLVGCTNQSAEPVTAPPAPAVDTTSMTPSLDSNVLLVALADEAAAPSDSADNDGWISMFDGETLDGWKATEKPENWTVEDGCIVGRGTRSHLFWMEEEFTDVEFKADVKLAHRGNSGMYFRAEFGPGWPKGYEAQVNNTAPDPVRTGSLYNLVKVFDQLVEDDTWWTQEIICRGNHIIIKVNGKVTVDFVDEKNTHSKGYLALQQHDPGSVVHYKNLYCRPLK